MLFSEETTEHIASVVTAPRGQNNTATTNYYSYNRRDPFQEETSVYAVSVDLHYVLHWNPRVKQLPKTQKERYWKDEAAQVPREEASAKS